MALIVLGAGATRGAKLREGDAPQGDRPRPLCLPPLDGDFFTQLQRIANDKHRETVNCLISDAVELFGHNFQLTLEIMFTTIEHQIRIVEGTTGERWGEDLAELRAKRTNLLQGIAAVLEESLSFSPQGGTGLKHRDCEYHQALVERLGTNDAVISFNYDCLIDHALRTHAAGKWNARYGYCLSMKPGPGAQVPGEKFWNAPDPPAKKDGTIRLLKLHGSLHFLAKSEGRFSLKERPYTRLDPNKNLHFEIIPPEWNKRFDEGEFGRIWAQAADEIHRAETIVVIGYSFPNTDLHTSSLFRVSGRPGRLKNVVLVNPDRDARHRAMNALRRGMQAKTRVMVFDTFEEFAAVDRKLWDRK
jgi:hypothetical protein